MRLAPRAAILPLAVRTPRTTAPLFSPACACFACQDSHGAHGNAHQEGNPFSGVILASAPHVASGWRKKTTSQQLRRSPAFGRWLPSTTWMPACDRPGIKRLAVLPAAARCARQRRGRGWAASHRRWRLCLGRLVKLSDGRPWSLAKEERPLQGRGINHHHHPQSQPPLLPPLTHIRPFTLFNIRFFSVRQARHFIFLLFTPCNRNRPAGPIPSAKMQTPTTTMKSLLLLTLTSLATARFGQEGAVQSVIQGLSAFGPPGQAGALAGQTPGVLLAGASACAKVRPPQNPAPPTPTNPPLVALPGRRNRLRPRQRPASHRGRRRPRRRREELQPLCAVGPHAVRQRGAAGDGGAARHRAAGGPRRGGRRRAECQLGGEPAGGV